MDLDNLTITTTNGTKFTGQDSAKLAFLIYQRFGCDMEASHKAWCRLLQNNCPPYQFEKLVMAGSEL